MRINALTLFSNDLESQKSFYLDTLGFKLMEESSEGFSISIGWSVLTFKKSKEKYLYHYCFLIPSNKFDEAYDWFNNHMNLVSLDKETKFNFESWNAKSFYFYDGNGNIAECIVRYDLENKTFRDFKINDLLCVNEIGAPSINIKQINEALETNTGSQFWKGDQHRFGTNGDNEGLFLLINPEIKKVWFPTEVRVIASPFEASISTNNGVFNISYSNQEMNISRKVLLH